MEDNQALATKGNLKDEDFQWDKDYLFTERSTSIAEDMRDQAYRYAYDILVAVINFRRKHRYQPKIPVPENVEPLLTQNRLRKLECFLVEQTKGLEDMTLKHKKERALTSTYYVFEDYRRSKEAVLENCLSGEYSDDKFLYLCTAVAYIAVHCKQRGLRTATEYAADTLHQWVKHILSRGTLENSSW